MLVHLHFCAEYDSDSLLVDRVRAKHFTLHISRLSLSAIHRNLLIQRTILAYPILCSVLCGASALRTCLTPESRVRNTAAAPRTERKKTEMISSFFLFSVRPFFLLSEVRSRANGLNYLYRNLCIRSFRSHFSMCLFSIYECVYLRQIQITSPLSPSLSRFAHPRLGNNKEKVFCRFAARLFFTRSRLL